MLDIGTAKQRLGTIRHGEVSSGRSNLDGSCRAKEVQRLQGRLITDNLAIYGHAP